MVEGAYTRFLLASIQFCMLRIMSERLTAQCWIDFALKALAREGYAVLKADVLARKMGISRGSFYWHFEDLATFHARVIAYWKQTATEAIIADIERYESPVKRMDSLLRHAFGHPGTLETRMRIWAENNKEAARAVNDVDHRRRMYIEQLLQDAGVSASLAATRAQLLYWAYLGAALSRSRLTGEHLNRAVVELKRIGLAGVPA
jgi:AcrR family transcriptional regulator